MYAIGFDTIFSPFTVTNILGGYSGYIGNGDSPTVYRFILTSRFSKRYTLDFKFQQGLRDFDYSTFSLGCSVNFMPPLK